MVLKSSINANKLAYMFLSNTLLLLRLNQDDCKPEESVCVGHLKAAFLPWGAWRRKSLRCGIG